MHSAPFARQVRQIELTLERWRWIPAFDTPPIIVNIPQFRLFAFRSTQDRKSQILQMDVIVGRTFLRTQTPVFVADMRDRFPSLLGCPLQHHPAGDAARHSRQPELSGP